jgi:hypothetical protein
MYATLRVIVLHRQFPLLLLVLAFVFGLFQIAALSTATFLLALTMMVMPPAFSHFAALIRASRVEIQQNVRMVVAWLRNEFRPQPFSPTYKLCWYLVAAGYFLLMMLPVALHSPSIVRWGIPVLNVATTTLGVIECVRRTYSVFRRTWARLIGKVAWAVSMGIFTCIASSMSRQYIFEMTGLDPSLFPTFTALLAVITLPIAWWLVLYIISLIWALIEVFIKMISATASSADEEMHENVTKGPQIIEKFIAVLRPLSVLAALVYIATLVPSPDPSKNPMLTRAAMSILVTMDYWPQRMCGSSTKELVTKIDATHYSVATFNGWQATLQTQTCLAPS